MAGLEIRACNGVGAEILGCDISNVGPDDFTSVQDAFAKHGVIFFRDQDITEEDHIAFAERWGTININRFFAAHPDYPQIAMVSKDVDDRDNIGGGWHTDHSYDLEPALGSMLVARELPETGGDTSFASMYAAYDALDEETKAQIEGMKAVHSAKHIFGTMEYSYVDTNDVSEGRIGNSDIAMALEDPVHPVVITHPLSGKKALYVNAAFTVRFEGMTQEESMPLLAKLYMHAAQERFTHRFKWEDGSIALWDNRATWHNAHNDYHGQRRIMHRITIEGCALS